MLVDINLIEKKHRPKLYWIIVTGLLIFLVIAFSACYSYYMSLKQQEVGLNRQLIYERQLNKIQQNGTKDKDQLAVQNLKKEIQWAKDYPISTVKMLKNIIELLPTRGFITNFSLQDDRSVHLIVQFDTSSDSAYFLKYLNEAKFVQNAEIENITTSNLDTSSTNTLPRYFAKYTIKLNENYLKNKDGKEE